MATVPKTGTKALTFTRGTGSVGKDGDNQSIVCDTCRLKETIVEAMGFCIHCKKYMCSDCKHEHTISEAYKTHIMLIGTEMPRDRNAAHLKRTSENCEKHTYKMAEYFCPKHNDVFCKECKDYKHAKCNNVNFVKVFAKGIKGRRDMHRTQQDIQRLLLNFEKLKTSKELKKQSMEDQMTECLKSVHNLRKDINAAFDVLENDMKASIEKRFSKECQDLEENKTKCLKKISALEEEAKNLDVIKTGDDAQCFVYLLRAKQKVSECEAAFTNVSRDNKDLRFEFEPNYKLLHFLKEIGSLGIVKASIVRPSSAVNNRSVTSTPSLDLPTNMMSSLKNEKNFMLCGEHMITSEDDKKTSCAISGSTFLPDGRLLLCDCKNHNLKLFDQHIKLKLTHTFEATPCDVASLNNREAVVTIPDRKELHFVIINPEFRTTRVVKTEARCSGIKAHKEGLLVTCYSHGMAGVVQLLDNEGGVKQRFERDVEGNPLFVGPFFIAINPKRDRFYVSDKALNTVAGATMGGKIVFRYRSKDLDAPGYITVDKEGCIYVCGRDSKNIHVLRPDGRKLKIFLSDDGFEATTISYRAADGLFIVSMYNSDRVRSYKLI